MAPAPVPARRAPPAPAAHAAPAVASSAPGEVASMELKCMRGGDARTRLIAQTSRKMCSRPECGTLAFRPRSHAQSFGVVRRVKRRCDGVLLCRKEVQYGSVTTGPGRSHASGECPRRTWPSSVPRLRSCSRCHRTSTWSGTSSASSTARTLGCVLARVVHADIDSSISSWCVLRFPGGSDLRRSA